MADSISSLLATGLAIGLAIGSAHRRCTGPAARFLRRFAANLALGKSLPDAIVVAKAYVTKAMEKGYTLGLWPGLPNHLYRLQAPGPPRSVAPEPVESHAAGHR